MGGRLRLQRGVFETVIENQGAAPIVYLLRDLFTTARSAGAVNGTAAEPGPGTRVVTDTASKLSISGEKLVINAVGRTTFGNPGIWFDAVTRTPGIRLFGKITITTASSNNSFGFDADQIGAQAVSSFYFRPTDIYIYDNTENVAVVGAWSTDIEYQCLIVLRSAGAFYFIKGGAYTNWTLLWSGSKNSVATLYPGFAGRDALVSVDDFNILSGSWLPIPLVYDSFARLNGAIGSSELSGPDGQVTPVMAWNNRTGTAGVTSNRAYATAVSGGLAIATVQTTTPNAYARCKVKRTTTGAGLILRYVDADNYIYAGNFAAGTCSLVKRVGGAEETVITGSVTLVSEGEVVVVASGTSFSLFYNKVLVGTGTIDDAALQTSVHHGMIWKDTDSYVTFFTAYARGDGVEYAELDNPNSNTQNLLVGRTAFYGDSITLGTGASDTAHRWTTLLTAARASQGWTEINCGLSGQSLQNSVQNAVATIGGAVNNNARDNYTTQLLAYNPKRVFIMFGINDLRLNDAGFTAENFQTDLGEVVDAIVATGVLASNIVIGSPPYLPAATYPLSAPYNGGTAEKHAAYVAASAAVAAAKGTKYKDIYAYMAANGGDALIGDGVHPNNAGHVVIKDGFLTVV